MPADPSEAGSESALNCGLWRDPGTVRTSTSWVTLCAASSFTNSSIGRVECPIVNTLQAFASSLDLIGRAPPPVATAGGWFGPVAFIVATLSHPDVLLNDRKHILTGVRP